jgi:chromosome segregation ATPase
VNQLSAENEDLNSTIQTLQAELLASNADADRAQRELDSLRVRAVTQGAQEAAQRERELHDLRGDLERTRIERDDFAALAEQEHALREEARDSVDVLRRDLELERELRARLEYEFATEKEKTANLQSVLEDFQSGKFTVGYCNISVLNQLI